MGGEKRYIHTLARVFVSMQHHQAGILTRHANPVLNIDNGHAMHTSIYWGEKNQVSCKKFILVYFPDSKFIKSSTKINIKTTKKKYSNYWLMKSKG